MNRYIHISVIFLLLLASCANRGQGPQGGPRDSIPPAILKEVPVNGTLNFNAKEILVYFDEYIQMNDVQKHVLISPPQQTPPEVKAIGKHMSVVFQEQLQDSTTYTIDFGAAICDYNEKTPLEGYVFSFSTGDVIDSLAISGTIYNAANLDPVTEVLVGIHRNPHDSAFTSLPFSRITRANSEGHFTIHNIQPGTYRIYALNDISRDYLYQPGEAFAWSDSLINPYCEVDVHTDTIWRDTIAIDPLSGDTLFTRLVDSTFIHPVTHFYPDSLVLFYFEEDKQRHYFQRILRDEQHAFTLLFAAPQDSMPIIRALRPSEVDSLGNDSAWVNFLDYALVQTSPHLDTITFWLTDSIAISMDSIYLQMQHLVSDSLYNLVPQTDTLLAVYRHPRLSEKAMETYLRNKQSRRLTIKSNASNKFEVYDTIAITSEFPLDSIHTHMIHLSHKVDTTFQSLPFQLLPHDSIGMTYHLLASLQPEQTYLLKIDSAAIRDIYGVTNDSIAYNIRLKALNEYASLMVKLTHYDPQARIQLLNDKDQVVRELPARPEGTKFEYLAASTFYLRMYIDRNNDGKWTTGDWLLRRQPEPVYYYPSKLKLRANWDFEENFDHLAIPQVQSKPKSLVGKASKKK